VSIDAVLPAKCLPETLTHCQSLSGLDAVRDAEQSFTIVGFSLHSTESERHEQLGHVKGVPELLQTDHPIGKGTGETPCAPSAYAPF
jgi:hypothetical protein